MRGKTVLVVDDDADLLAYVESLFSEAGAAVHTAANGREALRLLGVSQPDLVLLDVMMPSLDGWQTCQHIRRVSDVPVIFMTAVAQDEDIVRGLDFGAVDYVTKPFNPHVLLARARAALRASGALPTRPATTRYDDGYLSVDLKAERLSVNGAPAQLTDTEYKLFAFLFENAGQVVTYQEILEHVWGWGYEDAIDYVHVYIYHLRQKLEQDPGRPRYLRTERKLGYRFELQHSVLRESVA